MVKLSAPLALLALAIAGASAQAPNPSAAPSSGAPAPSSAAPAPPKPSSAPPAPPAQGGKSGAPAPEDGQTSSVCSALFGDPHAHPYDCQASKTVVPPYNLSSLVSYFVGGYSQDRADGAMVSEVANDLAGSVLNYYPTVTQSSVYIQWAMYEGLLSTIKARDPSFAPVDKIKPPPGVEDAAKRMAVPAAVAFGAAVVGGALLL